MAGRSYRKILEDMVARKLVIENPHYCHAPRPSWSQESQSFSKSYVIHHTVRAAAARGLGGRGCIEAEEAVLEEISSYLKISSENGASQRSGEEDSRATSAYEKLSVDYISLLKLMKGDAVGAMLKAMKLQASFKRAPHLKSGRWWHPFHFTSKKLRRALLLDGEKITEAFDVAGSDLHFLCKIMEQSGKFTSQSLKQELLAFEEEVKNDFRKKFGVSKATGKCFKKSKTAIKVLLNMSREPVLSEDEGLEDIPESKVSKLKSFLFSSSRAGQIAKWIFKNFPHVFMFLGYDNKNLWLKLNEAETETISGKMKKKLEERKIESLPLHDAIYIKVSDVGKVDCKKLFYESLGWTAPSLL